MIVLDASAAIDWLLQSASGRKVEERIYSHGESLHAPHLLDVEFTQVLRRLVRERTVEVSRAEQAIVDLVNLPITRYPHFVFLPRLWQLRHNLTAYDAVYIALAERLNATLVTRDARLSAATGHQARIEVF